MTPVLVFDIETVPDVARTCGKLQDRRRPRCSDAEVADHGFPAAAGGDRQRFPAAPPAARGRSFRARFSDGETFGCVRSATHDDSEGEIIQRSSTASRNTRRSSCRGTAAASICRCCITGGCATACGARYWDMRRRRPRVQLQQLHQPLPHASHRPDGPARDVSGARERAARRDREAAAGFPGKLGMDGSQVWDAYSAGSSREIRDYCETDVVNTYLVLLRFQLMRGSPQHGRIRKAVRTRPCDVGSVSGRIGRSFSSHWPHA